MPILHLVIPDSKKIKKIKSPHIFQYNFLKIQLMGRVVDALEYLSMEKVL